MLDVRSLPLRSDRAVLRVMSPDDAGPYAAGAADPAVRKFAHLPEAEYTEASVTTLIEGTIRDGLKRGNLAVLAIAHPDTNAFMGSLVIFDVENDSAEVGFWVHPDHRGRGITTAALALAAEVARRSGLAALTARTLPENRGAQRVLEQSGFTQTDTVREAAPSGQEAVLLRYVHAI